MTGPIPPLAPTVRLRHGAEMPRLGFGTYPLDDTEAEHAVATAIENGYRLIDTAALYGNEIGVGRGLRGGGVAREELFVTSKLTKEQQGTGTRRAVEESCARLGTDHLDLYLIHWPDPAQDAYVETFRTLADLMGEGTLKAVGVSNFKPHHLDRIIETTGVVPDVNQIQLSPYHTRDGVRAHHEKLGIVTEAWSPLGRDGTVFAEEPVRRAAERHGRTPAQTVLRWHVQQGIVPVPKSGHSERMRENLDVFGFELTGAELDEISGLDRGEASADDSDVIAH
ncbi:aldo/keto reductase [Streptomyces sp. CHA1]|uniref:aldo/keto reductase n=1 Tax=Streptomyces TaxID=1883 RepID=UPI0003C2BF36|nr:MULTISPECIES: aldo/keto reductase [Streptomyces]QPA02361.1 aldo/keto reductase [Streptomyces violascens]ESP96196.1 2, 5-diketo-D-gluconate reductase A [Streptomyces sp. GBA 94-10 4N24]ESQ02275.1 2, 5-diketo-D-gluconate reductase A [Streptomyces sp. PVA_94-07]MBP3081156.1 oxidoreductase [Streptomyces sp. 604F]MBT3160828.1 aldo/keto reductase [Streptomyces sp. G11C]